MCGIAGYVLRAKVGHSRLVCALLPAIRPRGPDDEGVWLADRDEGSWAEYSTDRTAAGAMSGRPRLGGPGVVPAHDLALINTRYSIIDPSPAGHQPFVSHDGSVVGVYNGEIYNYVELRKELEANGVRLRTRSDTEVLVEGNQLWGERLWEKLNGFWAAALYHRHTGVLWLARDRVGVAPLYYREEAAGFFFASSPRGLVAVEPASAGADRERVLGFIETGMKDLDDSTLYTGIRSLPAGTVVRLPRRAAALAETTARRYWALPQQRLTAKDLSFDEAVRQYRRIFFDAVEIRLRADIEIACELSGGLDSSSIVAVAALVRGNAVRTFTIKVPEHDEEPFARTILEQYPVDYRVLTEPEETFISDEPAFTRALQEPYHSPNIYTHFQMRRSMKASGVGVVLAGAGGDEVLAGYEDLFWPRAAAELRAAGRASHVIAYERGRGRFRPPTWRGRLWDAYWALRRRAFRLGKAVLGRRTPAGDRPLDAGGAGPLGEVPSAQDYARRYPGLGFQERRLYHFRVAMLPYYLRSNDHFTMAIPVEQRFPYLDYRMVEFGLQLPIEYLFKDGWTKYILRKAMEPYLPAAIVWRREKMGFPFAYERFLARHRTRFEPQLARLDHAGLAPGTPADYEDLRVRDPMRLWRMCSTALWLGSLDDR